MPGRGIADENAAGRCRTRTIVPLGTRGGCGDRSVSVGKSAQEADYGEDVVCGTLARWRHMRVADGTPQYIGPRYPQDMLLPRPWSARPSPRRPLTSGQAGITAAIGVELR